MAMAAWRWPRGSASIPERTCSAMRAEVKNPRASTTNTKPETDLSAGKIAGTTWYHRKICTSSGILRKNSTHALPKRTAHLLLGRVRSTPIIMPLANASSRANTDTDTVQPQADSIQSR